MRASIKAHVKPGDGIFLTSCVQHPMAWNSAVSLCPYPYVCLSV